LKKIHEIKSNDHDYIKGVVNTIRFSQS